MPYAAVFASDPGTLGTPVAPTTRGLIRLAQEGADTWNAWRHDYPVEMNPVTHQLMRTVRWEDEQNNNVIISIGGLGIDFTGFNFGEGACFLDQVFPQTQRAIFNCATFGRDTSFRNCQFRGGADFSNATFSLNTLFSDTTF